MRKRSHGRRSGAILIVVLTCLLVALSLVLTAVQSSVRARRECKEACLVRQTQLLIEAGTLRAIDKLRQSYDYEGEDWKPKILLERDFIASVQIELEPPVSQDVADSRKITIIAKLESNDRSHQATQRSFHFIIHKESLSSSEF